MKFFVKLWKIWANHQKKWKILWCWLTSWLIWFTYFSDRIRFFFLKFFNTSKLVLFFSSQNLKNSHENSRLRFNRFNFQTTCINIGYWLLVTIFKWLIFEFNVNRLLSLSLSDSHVELFVYSSLKSPSHELFR